MADYRRHRASYALGVVFPDGHEEWIRTQFEESAARVERGDDATKPADAVHRIAASALLAWSSSEKSYFYFRGFSRKSSTFHVLEKSGSSLSVKLKDLPDLLTHYLTRKAPGADMALKQRLDRALAPFVGQG